MNVFTIRDLRRNTGDLIREAEAGRLSLVTRYGRPVFVAVPIDASLMELLTAQTRLSEQALRQSECSADPSGAPLIQTSE